MPPPPKRTRGPGRPRNSTNKLGRWIDESRKTREEIAERLEISRQHLDKLCAGTRRPNLESAFAIEKLTSGRVPAKWWTTVPKHSGD